jgi:hypothetical protein
VVGGVATYVIAKKDGANSLQALGWASGGALVGSAIGNDIANLSISTDSWNWKNILKWAERGALRQLISTGIYDEFGAGKKEFGGIDGIVENPLDLAGQLLKSATGGAAFGVIQGLIGSGLQIKGIGVKGSYLGDFLYNAFVSSGKSIVSDWANNTPLFSDVNVTMGPITLTFGKSQTLFQVTQNLGTIGSAANLITSSWFFGLHPSLPVKAEFTDGGVFWTKNGFLNDFISIFMRPKDGGFLHFLINILNGIVNPGDGILTTNSNRETQAK